MIQPLRRIKRVEVTLSCGHRFSFVAPALSLPSFLLRDTIICIDCDPVPERKVDKLIDGGRLPKLKLVGGT